MARFVPSRFLCALTALCTLAGVGFAQSSGTGLPPFTPFQSGTPDTVNLDNLNAHYSIPIFNRPGRGVPFSYNLSVDSDGWRNLGAISVGGGMLTAGVNSLVGTVHYSVKTITCYSGSTAYTYDRYTVNSYIDPSGTFHPFLLMVNNGGPQCTPNPKNTAVSGVASDGSGVTLTFGYLLSQGATVTLPTGEVLSAAVVGPSGILEQIPYSLTDSNGNRLNVSPQNITVSDLGSVTDTLGTTALSSSGSAPNPVTYTYTAPNGAQASVVVTFKSQNIQGVFNCPQGYGDYQESGVPYADRITYPDSSYYQFTYEPTPGVPGSVTGRLASVKLPSGGTISYNYTGGDTGMGVFCFDLSPATLTRVTPDGTWTYSRSLTLPSPNPNGMITSSTTTITDPQGNQTVLNFSSSSKYDSLNIRSFETQRQVYSGSVSGTPLQTTINCYNGNSSNCANPGVVNSPLSEINVYRSLNGGSQAHIDTFYNTYSLVTEKDEYDFGATSPTRKTIITYDPTLGNNVLDKPSSVKTTDGNGNWIAETDYVYDEDAASLRASGASQLFPPSCAAPSGKCRGNVTTVKRFVTSSSNLASHFTHYDTGQVYTATDVNGAISTYTYGACGNSLPTSISEPLSMSRSFGWNCTGAVQTSATDENGQPTTTTYNDPYFWRPAQENFPDGGQISWTYNGTTSVTTTAKINSSQNAVSTGLLDGLGRVVQNQLNSDPEGVDYTDTSYDSLGRVASTSNPYRSTSDPTYGLTRYQYDALGRATQVTNPDGSTILTAYTGRATQVQDEGNGTRRVSRVSQVDALGRLLSVCEVSSVTLPVGTNPTPSSCGQDISATGFLTTYSYDLLGNITGVAQSGLNSRNFTYDSLSRLLTASNPEAGTITYKYDSDSNCPIPNSSAADLVSRVDARGIRTCMQYDALHRLTQKNYSDGTPTANFLYDQASAYGVTLTNTIGRISSETTASPNPTAEVFSYDQLGRVKINGQCTPLNCGTNTVYPLTYGYDLLGDMTSSTNGQSNTYGYTYNAAQRLLTMTSNAPNSPTTMFSAAHYNAAGSLTSATLGNNIAETRTYDSRLRFASITDGTVYSVNIPASGGYAPNSNILIANDSVNGNWTYGYDDFNRLLSANATAQAYTYDYDRYGNRWHQNGPHTSSLGFDANNRIVAGSGVTYDANGNTTNDGTTAYTFDAENRLTSATNTSRGLTCYIYNAEGQRVRKTYSTVGTCAAPTSSTPNDYLYDLSGHLINIIGIRNEVFAGDRHLASYTFSSTYFMHADWLGTERARSNSSGASYATCTSLPFGDWLTCAGGSDPSPDHFTGKQHDYESGVENFDFRYDSSSLGRFISPDPLGGNISNPQSLNRYSYVLNNPLNLIDPLGLQCTSATMKDDQGNLLGSSSDCGPDIGTLPIGTGANLVFLSPGSSDSTGGEDLSQLTNTPPVNPDAGSATSSPGLATNSSELDATQLSLGAFGMIPGPIGTGANLVNAGISLYRGDYGQGALNLAFAIPLVGTIGRIGEAGELAAGIIKNTERIESVTGAAYRIPDELSHIERVIGEVKNVRYQAYTNQLRDFATYAQKYGYQFRLYIRQGAELSAPLQDAINSGLITHVPY